MRRLGAIAALPLPLALLLAVALPSSASAEVFCDYVEAGEPGPQENLLSIVAVGQPSFTSADSELVIARDGEGIAVTSEGAPVLCAGAAPTPVNLDLIRIASNGAYLPKIDLGPGALAPGATLEPAGASEIELQVFGNDASTIVEGSAREESFEIGESPDGVGLNLDAAAEPGGDLDLELRGPGLLYVFGGAGADAVDGSGLTSLQAPNPVQLSLFGGDGADSLRGSTGSFSLLAGGAGADAIRSSGSRTVILGGADDDRLAGGPDRDEITGGPGRDRIRARAGHDLIQTGDGERDSVDCGPGRDRHETFDPGDRERRCELRGPRPDRPAHPA